jgi:hypothetical protein
MYLEDWDEGFQMVDAYSSLLLIKELKRLFLEKKVIFRQKS